MLLCPSSGEVRGIIRFLGRLSLLLGVVFFVPALVSLICHEPSTAIRLAFGAVTAVWVGNILYNIKDADARLSVAGAFTLAAVAWLHATLLTGWTYWLTGCFASFTDACFDAMSGYTTTGLTLLVDLDHAPEGLQFLRHFVTFLGGQGIIVLFLVFVSESAPEYFSLYAAEGKDERLWPNVLHTARAIWWISVGFLAVGTTVLYPLMRELGLAPMRAFLEAVYLFEGAWSTGGFAPHAQNLMYYHSWTIEAVTLVIFILGSLNFAVHHRVMSGNRREFYLNTEIRSFAVTMLILSLLAAWFCIREGVYATPEMAVRKVFYQLASAHTTTGNMTLYARQFVNDWPLPAALCLVIAMMIGGSACSTAGGIKGMRLVLVMKTIWFEIQRQLLPPHAVVTVRWHHLGPRLIDPELGYRALLPVVLFCGMYLFVTMAGVIAGYPLFDSLFEGISAASNSGLSCGITTVATPTWLKVVYIVAMWLGRLEFTAVLIFAGYLLNLVRGRGCSRLRSSVIVGVVATMLLAGGAPVTAGEQVILAACRPASVAVLVENSRELDGGAFVLSGEVVGEPLSASGGVWLNILEDGNPIAIFCPDAWSASAGTLLGGNRLRRGHVVRIRGVLHRFCSEHSGELDIHTGGIEVLEPPLQCPERVSGPEVVLLLLISSYGLCCLRRREPFLPPPADKGADQGRQVDTNERGREGML